LIGPRANPPVGCTGTVYKAPANNHQCINHQPITPCRTGAVGVGARVEPRASGVALAVFPAPGADRYKDTAAPAQAGTTLLCAF
jgi:hypothetical protein